MSYNDDFGPKWCMSSEEVGGGFAFLIALFLAGFILLPAFLLGVYFGSNIWNVKIIKYSLGVMIATIYGYELCKLHAYCVPSINTIVIVTMIALSWLILDFIHSNKSFKHMWVTQTVLKTYRWLFSA